jgi:GntR family galactonate operon transcriptional repressor
VVDRSYPGRGLHGRVVHELGKRIVTGTIPPGEVFPPEDELGGELGVSRSVVREAIKVLMSKGLVEVRPKTGTRARPRRSWHLLDPDVVSWEFEGLERYEDLRELAEVRATVEPSAARLAAQRRTDDDLADIEAHCRRMASAGAEPLAFHAAELDFHVAVVRASRNTLLSHMAAVMRVALEATASQRPIVPDPTGDGLVEYKAVLEAIRSEDPTEAERAMRSLLDRWWPGLGAGETAAAAPREAA